MGNLSTLAREALRQTEGASISKRILVSRKIICDLERQPDEASLRVCADLRKVILSVTTDAEASPEQVRDAKGLLIRVRTINPRNQKDDDEVSIEQPIVAGTSASQVPRTTSLTYNSIFESLDSVFGNSWRRAGRDFSQEERLNFIEHILGSKPSVSAVKSLQTQLYTKDSLGFTLAGTYPLVAQFIEDFLTLSAVKDAAKYRIEEEEKARQWIADLDLEMAK